MKRRQLGAGRMEPGEYEAICLRAERHTSAAGNPCVKWTWALLPSAEVLEHYTVVKRAETGLVAQALGLPVKGLRLAEAAGRKARVTVSNGDFGAQVQRVRAV